MSDGWIRPAKQLILTTICGALVASSAAAADLGSALASLDNGDAVAARAQLDLLVGEVSFYQALASQGEARKQAAERAAAATPAGSWIEVAARGLAADGGGDPAAAVTALERATTLSPNDFRLWNELGRLYARQGDDAKARSAYERATTLNPAYPAGLVGLGDALRRAGDFGGAYNAYNHAVGDGGKPVSALIGRAAARLYMGDSAGALADLERAAEVAAPGNDRYRALMGTVYVRTYLRQLPDGLDHAEAAARMWGEMGRGDMVAATMNATGRVLLETGNATAAESWYERGWQSIQVSNLPPEERTIWQVRWLHGISRCAAAERDNERANSLAEQARQLMAGDAANQEHYAWIGPYLDGYLALQQRRYDDAIAALQKSDLERPHLMLLLADAYARNRDRTDARVWYQKAYDAANGLDTESVIVRPEAAAWLAKNK